MTENRKSRFVADGVDRLRAPIHKSIRAEVEREYAERLQTASWLERMKIRREISREVALRMEREPMPSREAIFSSSN